MTGSIGQYTRSARARNTRYTAVTVNNISNTLIALENRPGSTRNIPLPKDTQLRAALPLANLDVKNLLARGGCGRCRSHGRPVNTAAVWIAYRAGRKGARINALGAGNHMAENWTRGGSEAEDGNGEGGVAKDVLHVCFSIWQSPHQDKIHTKCPYNFSPVNVLLHDTDKSLELPPYSLTGRPTRTPIFGECTSHNMSMPPERKFYVDFKPQNRGISASLHRQTQASA